MLLRTSAKPAFERGIPLFLAAFVIETIITGNHGLSIRDHFELYSGYGNLRIGLLVLWSISLIPASRSALFSAGLAYLRWLPRIRLAFLSHWLLVLLMLHMLPTLPLLLSGEWLWSLALLSAGMGSSSAIILLFGHWLDRCFALLSILAIGVLTYLGHPLWMITIGMASTFTMMPRIWSLASYSPSRFSVQVLRGGSFSSLIIGQVLHLWRKEQSALFRVGLFLGGSLLLSTIVLQANASIDIEDRTMLVLVVSSFCFSLIFSSLGVALRRAQRCWNWLYASLGLSISRLGWSALAILSVPLMLSALAFTVVANSNLSFNSQESLFLFLYLIGHGTAWMLLSASVQGSVQRVSSTCFWVLLPDLFFVGLFGPAAIVFELAVVSLLIFKRQGSTESLSLFRA